MKEKKFLKKNQLKKIKYKSQIERKKKELQEKVKNIGKNLPKFYLKGPLEFGMF